MNPHVSDKAIAVGLSLALHAGIVASLLPEWHSQQQHRTPPSIMPISFVLINDVVASHAAPSSLPAPDARESDTPVELETTSPKVVPRKETAAFEAQPLEKPASPSDDAETQESITQEKETDATSSTFATRADRDDAVLAQDSHPSHQDGFITSIEIEYKTALRAAIEARKFYPRKARRMRREGDVIISFTVLRTGRITDIEVAASSGNSILDNAAMDAVRKLAKFDPIPEEVQHEAWAMTIPMQYTLL